MSHILMIWTIVGFAGTQTSTYKVHDWRSLGVFSTQQQCEEAARQLVINPKNFRCVKT